MQEKFEIECEIDLWQELAEFFGKDAVRYQT